MDRPHPGFDNFHNRQAGIAAIIHGISLGICVATSFITVAFLVLRSKLPKRNRLALIFHSDVALTFSFLFFVPNLVTQYNYFSGKYPGHVVWASMRVWESPAISQVVFHLITWLYSALMLYMVATSWCHLKWMKKSFAIVYFAIIVSTIVTMAKNSGRPDMIMTMVLFLFEAVAFDAIWIRLALNRRAARQNTASEEGAKHLDFERHIIFLIAGGVYITARIFWLAAIFGLGGEQLWSRPIVATCAFLGTHLLILHSATSEDASAMCDPIEEPSSSSGPIHL